MPNPPETMDQKLDPLLETSRIVRCPTCGGDSIYGSTNLSRPFCSDRCRNMDFGAWASENFRMQTQATPDDLLPDDEMPIQ